MEVRMCCMESLPEYNPINLEVFERLSAFNLYKTHGFDLACSIYPEQRGFILANMYRSLEEVRKECYKHLDRKDPPYRDFV